MASLTFKYLQEVKKNKKVKNKFDSKRVETALLVELKNNLEEYLITNDKVLLEINPNVVGEFLNILNDKVLTVYSYDQIDNNKFLFYNKEFSL